METVFVAQRKVDKALLLLVEMGLHDGVNVAFDGAGQAVRLGRVAFVDESDQELAFESDLLSDAQRVAYVSYWTGMDQTAAVEREIRELQELARLHPIRNNLDRHGGVYLPAGQFSSIAELANHLRDWLAAARDEDVVGDIGTYAGRTWVWAAVPDLNTRATIPLEIHADSKAFGIARFLSFVIRCGGPEHVRATRDGGRTVLVARDGQTELESGHWFYFSQNW